MYLKLLNNNQMKKLLLAVVLAGTAAYAQAQVQIGPKVGLNVSTMDLGDSEEKEEKSIGSTLGLNIGVAANIKFSDAFSFAPELSFSQRGYGNLKYSTFEIYEGTDVTVEYKTEESFRASYMELPLLFRGTFGGAVKGYVNAGPSLGYWLGGRYKGEGSGETPDGTLPFTFDLDVKFVDEYKEYVTEEFVEVSKEDANRLQIGAAIGGGVILPVAGKSLLVDARYTLAFNDIYNNMPEKEKARNKGFALSLIYLLGK